MERKIFDKGFHQNKSDFFTKSGRNICHIFRIIFHENWWNVEQINEFSLKKIVRMNACALLDSNKSLSSFDSLWIQNTRKQSRLWSQWIFSEILLWNKYHRWTWTRANGRIHTSMNHDKKDCFWLVFLVHFRFSTSVAVLNYKQYYFLIWLFIILTVYSKASWRHNNVFFPKRISIALIQATFVRYPVSYYTRCFYHHWIEL